MFRKRPLTLAMAVLALAGSTVAASVPADAAGYTTGGAIGSLYNSQGRTLGAPTSNEYTGHADRVQNFRYGLIYWSPATGAHSVRGGILGEYRRLGTDAGKLGLPITEERAMAGGGVYQQFKGGIIYWSSATGAHATLGAILGEYKNQGTYAGKLGLPITGEKATVRGGVYQQFKGGIIYWTPATGAHATLGAIRALYAQEDGAERGPLGFPTSSEISVRTADASFVYQNFERGMISWNGVRIPGYNEDPSHAHAVYGDFYKKFLAAGGVKVLGYISENESTDQPDGTGAITVALQWFENGGILYKIATGAHYLPNAWASAASSSDQQALGFPTSDVQTNADGTQVVSFEHGRMERGQDGKFTVILATPSPTAPPVTTPAPSTSATPAPTPTQTAVATPTATPAPTDAVTPSPSGTAVPTPTDSPTGTPGTTP